MYNLRAFFGGFGVWELWFGGLGFSPDGPHDTDRRAVDGVELRILALLIRGYSSGMWRKAFQSMLWILVWTHEVWTCLQGLFALEMTGVCAKSPKHKAGQTNPQNRLP